MMNAQMVQQNYQTLLHKLSEIKDISAATSLLHWDQEVYMPPKAAENRGRQLATLSSLGHRMFTDSTIGELLKSLKDDNDQLNPDQNKLVDETLYDYDRATKLPEKFVHEFSLVQSQAYEAWTKARNDKNYAVFQPHLQKVVELLQQKADLYSYEDTPYNALLNEFERGIDTKTVQSVFDHLKQEQSTLVDAIVNSPNQPKTDWLQQKWDESRQWDFTLEVLKDMGYDFEAGRQDKSVHPFTIGFGIHDVRITTRLSPDELFSALTGSMHEGGHALYEQGFLPEDNGTTLGDSISLGIHESQSRLWENMIGRSEPFWRFYGAKLRHYHKPLLENISDHEIYQAINKVERTFIRVEADECTYNLHIILRFDIERALIEGDLNVADVPTAWNEQFEKLMGLKVPSDDLGCLQDIHWAHGAMGYFPTYALGNLYAAQFFEQIDQDIPTLWDDIAQGKFDSLLNWLRKNIHQVGRRMTAPELVQSITSKALSADSYMKYLREKYGKIYGLENKFL